MKKTTFLIGLIILVIGIIGFETFYYVSHKDNPDDINDGDDSSNIDTSQYLVDITTPYNKDNLDTIFHKESDALLYYTIDGLLNKKVQDKVNDKIKETVNALRTEYKDKMIGGAVYSNFENTLSYVIQGFDSDDMMDADNFIKYHWHDNNIIATLNFDLTTGKVLTLNDVVNSKDAVKNKLLTILHEDVSKSIGLICSGGPCENPNPDYSNLDDSILSVINKFNSNDYIFYYSPVAIFFQFKNVYISNPEIIYTEHDTKDECLAIPNATYEYSMEWSNGVCIDQTYYDTTYETFIDFYKLTDNLIVYDRFKTDKTIYQNPSTKIDRKFTLTNEIDGAIDTRIVETDDSLIDYVVGIGSGDNNLAQKVYNDIIRESAGLKTNDFNLYHISGNNSLKQLGSKYYDYFDFDVYHYNISREEYQNYRKRIYLEQYDRYEATEGELTYREGYDYLKQYLTKKAFYYYIYDENGNAMETQDILSDTFDFSTIIPSKWLEQSNYKDLNEMLKNAYIIIGYRQAPFETPNRLIFYECYNPSDNQYELYMKYKGQTVVLAKEYQDIAALKEKIFK